MTTSFRTVPLLSVLPFFSFLSAATTVASAEEPSSGRFRVEVERLGEKRDYFVHLRQDGEKVSGVWVSPRTGRYPFEGGTYKDGKLSFRVKRDRPEDTRVYGIEAESKGPDRFEGKFTVDGEEAGTAVLTRRTITPEARKATAGKWNAGATGPDGQQITTMLEITEEGDELRAKSIHDQSTFEIFELDTDGKVLEFDLPLLLEGNEVRIHIRAAYEGRDALVGRWSLGQGDLSGDWKATRAAAKPAEPAADPAVVKAYAGKWYGVSAMGGEKKSFQLELSSDGGKISGKAHSEAGVLDLRDVKLSGRRLSFSLEVSEKERKVQMKIECELGDDEVLRGKFTGHDGATGELTARKPLVL